MVEDHQKTRDYLDHKEEIRKISSRIGRCRLPFVSQSVIVTIKVKPPHDKYNYNIRVFLAGCHGVNTTILKRLPSRDKRHLLKETKQLYEKLSRVLTDET